MKPFSPFREGIAKLVMVNSLRQRNDRPNRPFEWGPSMIKAVSAAAVVAFIAAALTVLPGFAPTVEASTPQVLAKGDRLDIRPVGRDCSGQAWPNFEASCLRRVGSNTTVREARLVTADRTP
jgi:hypothetical protein